MLLSALLIIAAVTAAPDATYSWRQTLDAIRVVETGGCANDGIGAKGDGGRALGPYQIWSVYHQDAAERDPTLTDYKRCLTSKSYSERVVAAYMRRYARGSLERLQAHQGTLGDVEVVSRIHNGGPRGASKDATMAYWRKVRGALKAAALSRPRLGV